MTSPSKLTLKMRVLRGMAEQIAALYRSGRGILSLSGECGCTYGTIRRIILTQMDMAEFKRIGHEHSQDAGRRGHEASGTQWTAKQCAFVQANYGSMTARQIAATVNHSIPGVYNTASKLGLTTPRPFKVEGFEAFLREKHAMGWSDEEICQAWKCERHTVGDWRKRLGLPHNALSEHRRRRVAEKTAEQLRAAGLPSLAALRGRVFEARVKASGWPAGVRRRQVDILNLLWENGPMTREQIANALKLRPKSRSDGSGRTWFPFYCNPPKGAKSSPSTRCTYFSDLVARGLVVNLGRIVSGRGQGRNVVMYSLPLTIERGPQTTRESPNAIACG